MKFNLYTLNRFGSKIYITQFDPNEEQHNLFSTYNEKLSLADNDQVNLTFSISRKILDNSGNLIVNPYLKYLVLGTKLWVETLFDEYELIVAQIAPKMSSGNTVYEFLCKDVLSYQWSRQWCGYSYNTMERGGVKTLYEIATDILRDCNLDAQWMIKPTNSHIYPNQSLLKEKITLQIDNSNPYNALIEALNVLNASMLVNYRKHEIRFYQKDRTIFSGYRYRPETNLKSLSATYNIDEIATILHVTGGTDEQQRNITLVPAIPQAVLNYLQLREYKVPEEGFKAIKEDTENFSYLCPMPSGEININAIEWQAYLKEVQAVDDFLTIADKLPCLGQFLYNFDFFLQNGILTKQQHEDLTRVFNAQMRDINLKLKPLTITYYNQLWDLQKRLIDIESKIEQLNAANMQLIKENRKAMLDRITSSNIVIDETKLDIEQIQLFQEDAQTTYNTINYMFDEDFFNLYSFVYGPHYNLKSGSYVPELQDLKNQIENYITIRDESRYNYYLYQHQYYEKYNKWYELSSLSNENVGANYDFDQVNLQSDITYYYNRFYMALQMCGNAENFNDFLKAISTPVYYNNIEYLNINNENRTLLELYSTDEYKCIPYYVILFGKIYSHWNTDANKQSKYFGVYNELTLLEQQNKALWSYVYTNYSSVVYEATYENTDELDSISLYNQAVSYFETYYKPKSSYSIEVLNLEELEQIGTPNLKVNSRIRVYNEDLNLDEGTSYNNDENTKLNNISYTNNELLVTSINYELRKSAAISITVEQIIQYQSILQKLIKSIK